MVRAKLARIKPSSATRMLSVSLKRSKHGTSAKRKTKLSPSVPRSHMSATQIGVVRKRIAVA
jgi:hypothetical protein